MAAECNYRGCRADVVFGRKKCRKHLDEQASYTRAYQHRTGKTGDPLYVLEKPTGAPRPAWMDDPSLLPKKPPGRSP